MNGTGLVDINTIIGEYESINWGNKESFIREILL